MLAPFVCPRSYMLAKLFLFWRYGPVMMLAGFLFSFWGLGFRVLGFRVLGFGFWVKGQTAPVVTDCHSYSQLAAEAETPPPHQSVIYFRK